MPRDALIQVRQGTAAQWASVNPILASGEPSLETDTRVEKTGDGVTAYNSLAASGGGGSTGLTNIDGGNASSVFGGTTGIDGGNA